MKEAYDMSEFDFVRCVVDNEHVYCTDAEGNVYRIPLPEEIPVSECPQQVLKRLLAVHRGGKAV
jgi:hypothetical protein